MAVVWSQLCSLLGILCWQQFAAVWKDDPAVSHWLGPGSRSLCCPGGLSPSSTFPVCCRAWQSCTGAPAVAEGIGSWVELQWLRKGRKECQVPGSGS